MDIDSWSIVKSFVVDYQKVHQVKYICVVDHLKSVFVDYKYYQSSYYYDMISGFFDEIQEGLTTNDEMLQMYYELVDDFSNTALLFSIITNDL